MERQEIKILLIEDDKGDADYCKEVLRENKKIHFVIEWAKTLNAAFELLEQKKFDIVLLDLNLTESQGLNTFASLHSHAAEIPIVVLTGLDDENVALQAVRKGAQDYLVKNGMDGKILSRVIIYAIERHRTQVVFRSLSIIDELTGLYNRRGFLKLAEHHIDLAYRSKKELLLFFLDLDGLKLINDEYGHQEGDQAIIRGAELLKETFRSSDIIARLGGDEFTVLMIDIKASEAEFSAQERLRLTFKSFNNTRTTPYEVSFSSGTSIFDPNRPGTSIEELLAMADKALYDEKLRKRMQRYSEK